MSQEHAGPLAAYHGHLKGLTLKVGYLVWPPRLFNIRAVITEALRRLPQGVQIAVCVDLHCDVHVGVAGDGLDEVRRLAQLQEQGDQSVR